MVDRMQRPVVLAAITGAHGIHGEVRIKLFGDGLAGLKRHKTFNEGKLTVTKLSDDGKGGAIARFAEVSDRNGAEALRGTALSVPRAALPPLAEGEYYHADLIGLPAVTPDGAALGVVVAVENFGAGDVIEIERAPDPSGDVDGKAVRFMVPMIPAAVPAWDEARVVIDAAWVE